MNRTTNYSVTYFTMFNCLPRLFILITFLSCIGFHGYAQVQLFSILKTDAAYKQSALKAIEERYNEDISQVKGDNKKYFKEIYKQRFDYIKSNFDMEGIVTDSAAISYINALVKEILAANPALQALKPRVLLYRAWWPNASSLGEGTVLVNIGIINKFSNEAQLAFVLCHELAHLYLNHSNNAIDKYINTVYSDEFQKELKKISKQEYEKNRQLDKLAKSIVFKDRRHSREHESEADSMAIEFMKNTEFDLRESGTALAMLDSIDNDKFNIAPPLARYFNNTAYPFREAWLKEPDAFFGGVQRSEEDQKVLDSLKTHPDCKKRVQYVTPILTRYYKPGTKQYIQEQSFRDWQQVFDREVIAYAYERDNVSLALYYSLQALDHYPDDTWLMAMIGNSLNRMYVAQKKHELNKISELPSPYHEKKYNQFLHFIQNLSLADIASISYYFLEEHKAIGASNETYVYALINSKENYNKPAEKQEWINYYKTKFTKPIFTF